MLHDREYMKNPQPARWLDFVRSDAVTTIIVINVVVFILQYLGIGSDRDGGGFHQWGALSIEALTQGRVLTVVTHMFVHQGPFHLLGNCMMIFFMGKALQSLIGARYFLYIYFLSGLVGAALEMSVGWLTNEMHPMVGASACAFGVFLALAVMLPQEMITALLAFIVPVQMRLWNMAMLFVGLSLVLGLLQVFNVLDLGVAHFAHLGGAFAGWWFVRMLGYGGTPVTYERLWNERHEREQQRELAGVPKPKRRAAGVSIRRLEVPTESLSAKEFIAREIDPILDKIATHGIHSLTEPERDLLERARHLLESAHKVARQD